MMIQPNRYYETRPYANLLEILPVRTWGALYIVVALLLSVYVAGARSPIPSAIAHTTGFILTSVWLGAFAIRWWTDDLTTSTNTVSWLLFLFLIVRSVSLTPVVISKIDAERRRTEL